jgi:hypothetical protein
MKNSQTGSSNDGFYESKREWMGKRHVMMAYEGYATYSLLLSPVVL